MSTLRVPYAPLQFRMALITKLVLFLNNHPSDIGPVHIVADQAITFLERIVVGVTGRFLHEIVVAIGTYG